MRKEKYKMYLKYYKIAIPTYDMPLSYIKGYFVNYSYWWNILKTRKIWCQTNYQTKHQKFFKNFPDIYVDFYSNTEWNGYGHTDTRRHGRTDTQTHGQTNTRTHELTDSRTHGHMDTWTHSDILYCLMNFTFWYF